MVDLHPYRRELCLYVRSSEERNAFIVSVSYKNLNFLLTSKTLESHPLFKLKRMHFEDKRHLTACSTSSTPNFKRSRFKKVSDDDCKTG